MSLRNSVILAALFPSRAGADHRQTLAERAALFPVIVPLAPGRLAVTPLPRRVAAAVGEGADLGAEDALAELRETPAEVAVVSVMMMFVMVVVLAMVHPAF